MSEASLSGRSAVFKGRVLHSRRSPVEHTFDYPVYLYRFPLTELPKLGSRLLSLFGYNTHRLISVWDRDYLFEQKGTILERLSTLLLQHGVDPKTIARVELITGARFFNYVFNPVNFYYCYGHENEVLGHVVEINNTYNQRHPYVLFKGRISGGKVTYTNDKEFFVSPFNRIEGSYQFVFSLDPDVVDVRIDLVNEGGKPLVTRLWGSCTPLTVASLLQTLIAFPLGAILTMPRILWQAQVLRFKKRLPMMDPPPPPSPKTINTRQS